MTVPLAAARTEAHRVGADHGLPVDTALLADALRSTLAEPVVSRVAVPAVPVSAMDGWAVAGPGPWQVVGSVRIGAPPTRLEPGMARVITTGGAVPAGATAVLRRERAVCPDGDVLRAEHALRDDADVRCTGEELSPGTVVAEAGRTVTAGIVAAAIVGGLESLRVRRRPRTALVVLGDEVATGVEPTPGSVRDAFAVPLPAALGSLGADVTVVRHLPDDREALRAFLDTVDADLVVTTGGTGHSDCDVLVPALEAAGGTIAVRGVGVRPGHPTVLGHLSGRPLLGLPGNPFAAFAALVALGQPLIAGLVGAPARPPVPRFAVEALSGAAGCVRLVAARETECGVVPVARQGAGMASVLATADVLAVVEPAGVRAGGLVPVFPLPWCA